MGVLDDLKKEAEKKQQEQQLQGAEVAAQQDFYAQHLHPVMRQAHDYFAELAKTLQAVDPDVCAPYSLDPEQKASFRLKQQNYQFRSDNYDNPYKLIIGAECQLAKRHEYLVRGRGSVTRYAALLEEHQFPHYTKDELDQAHQVVNSTFILEGPLKVQIRFLASPEDECIYIDLLNLEPRPNKRYKMPPGKVDEALLDRLARMLVREESVLVEVQISADTREQLRQKLQQERLRQAAEQAKIDALAEAERQAEEEARLVNRARKSVTGLAGGLKKILSKD